MIKSLFIAQCQIHGFNSFCVWYFLCVFLDLTEIFIKYSVCIVLSPINHFFEQNKQDFVNVLLLFDLVFTHFILRLEVANYKKLCCNENRALLSEDIPSNCTENADILFCTVAATLKTVLVCTHVYNETSSCV